MRRKYKKTLESIWDEVNYDETSIDLSIDISDISGDDWDKFTFSKQLPNEDLRDFFSPDGDSALHDHYIDLFESEFIYPGRDKEIDEIEERLYEINIKFFDGQFGQRYIWRFERPYLNFLENFEEEERDLKEEIESQKIDLKKLEDELETLTEEEDLIDQKEEIEAWRVDLAEDQESLRLLRQKFDATEEAIELLKELDSLQQDRDADEFFLENCQQILASICSNASDLYRILKEEGITTIEADIEFSEKMQSKLNN